MNQEELCDYEWIQSKLVDFVCRISDLLEASREAEQRGDDRVLDANWIEIHRLLIALHEQVSESADHDTVVPLVMSLNGEIATLERLIGTTAHRAISPVLH